MIFVYILKIIADLSFYFTFASFIAAVFALPGIILFLPPAAYVIYSVIAILKWNHSSKNSKLSGQFVHKQFAYEGIFTLYLKLFFPFAFVMILFARSYFETASLPFAITFFTSAVILMRMMRQQPQVRKQLQFRLFNMLPIVCVFLAGIALTSRQFLNLSSMILSLIYFNVIAPILLALGMAIAFILSPLFWLLSPVLQEGAPVHEGYMGDYDYQEGAESALWTELEVLRSLAGMVLVLLVVYLLVKFFRTLMVQQLRVASVGDIIQKYVSVYEEKPAKGRSRGPVGQVRRYYRRFLRFCRKNGVPSEMYMTSADYESLSTERFNLEDEAARFRDIYIAGRYGGKEVTQNDVASAKKLYQRIKEAGKPKSF